MKSKKKETFYPVAGVLGKVVRKIIPYLGKICSVKFCKVFYDMEIRKNSSDYPIVMSMLNSQEYSSLCDRDASFIIDAGANIGGASVFFSRKYPNAKIIAIEPDEDNFKLLVKNTSKYNNVIPLKLGLWGKNTSLKVTDAIDNAYWGLQTREGYDDGNCIQSITIDDLIKKYDINKIDILKIDIEGAEKNVFEADCDWLNKTNTLSIELHDGMTRGCSIAFFKKIAEYPDFELSLHGENIVLKRYLNEA